MIFSQKPYLLRALIDWCYDNGKDPLLVVRAMKYASLPEPYVKDGRITLDVSAEAIAAPSFKNDFFSFKARFSGVSYDISFPPDYVEAIFTGDDSPPIGFPVRELDEPPQPPEPEEKPQAKPKKPSLRVISS